MIHRVKTLGLGLLAICAMGAFMASSASASFDAEVEHVILEGNQTATKPHVFSTPIGKVECKKAKFTGTSLGKNIAAGVYTTEDITVSPSYSECTAFGFPATVEPNGCTYTQTRTGKDANGTPIGPVHILCPEGKKIKIVAFGFCTMEIPPQTPGGHLAYHNEGAGASRDVLATTTVTGVKYEGNCGSGTTASYTGDTTVKGFATDGKTQVGIWVT